MSRLPITGQDSGTWGNILNDFLLQAHTAGGLLKSNSVSASQIQDGVITNTKISPTANIDQSKIANLSTDLSNKAETSTTITGTNSISGGGDLSTNRTLSLVNDAAAPGNSKYYGTDGGGTKGYYDLPAGGAGEANTASNVNTAGVGVFKQKTGVDLEFKGINAGSNKVTITDDVANNEIDINVAEANFANIPQSAVTNLTTDLGNKQAADADLTAIAGLTPNNDDILQRKAGAWTNSTPAQVKTDLALTKSDVGLSNVDNTSDANKPVSTATSTALSGKVDTTRSISAGTGLTGGGNLTADRSFSVNYGTTAGTAAQGNDARLSMFGHYSSGYYYYISNAAVSTLNTLGNGTVRAMPVAIVEPITITRIGAEINTAGEAGSLLRLGIYNDSSGIPGTLLLDAGTIAGDDDMSVQELTISQALSPGVYWFAAVVQSAPSTQPTVYVVSVTQYSVPMPTVNLASLPTLGNGPRVCLNHSASVTSGALPATFTPNSTGGAFARIFYKVA